MKSSIIYIIILQHRLLLGEELASGLTPALDAEHPAPQVFVLNKDTLENIPRPESDP